MRRPAIALLVDVPDWAYARIAGEVQSALSDELRCEVFHALPDPPQPSDALFGSAYYAERHCTLFFQLFSGGFDLVHVFSRGEIRQMFHTFGETPQIRGLYDFEQRVFSVPITTSVYDHLYADAESSWRMFDSLNVVAAAYTVPSPALERLYAHHPFFPPPGALVYEGVDLERFRPAARVPETGKERSLVVGWVGNSDWNALGGAIDHKGVRTVLTPAVELLRQRGQSVELRLRDRRDGWVPEVQTFYHGLDVYVCASESEATAVPVLEAMACGLPVASTDVGLARELFGPAQRELILAERSPEALAAVLGELAANPELRARLGAENRERIGAWAWTSVAERWRPFFRQVLADAAGGVGRMTPHHRALRAAWWRRLRDERFSVQENRRLEHELRKAQDSRPAPRRLRALIPAPARAQLRRLLGRRGSERTVP